jgi:putative 2OG-Fe(II) oxygenase
MDKIINKLISNGFVKGEQKIIDIKDLEELTKIILLLRSQQIEKGEKSPFLKLVGSSDRLDILLEKIISNKYVKENLKQILGERYLLMSPSARFSDEGDSGLEIHQDAVGETGLLFLLTDQKEGQTVMVKASHRFPGRISNILSWGSKKLINIISSLYFSITGNAGDHYYWFHKTWHGRKPNTINGESSITLFFPFFPFAANRFDIAEKNQSSILKTRNQYLKNIMSQKIPYNDKVLEIPICLKIEKFDIKALLNINFIIFLLKISILEVLFSPVRILRLLRKIKF